VLSIENLIASVLQKILPICIFRHIPRFYYTINSVRFKIFPRPSMFKETAKAKPRRLIEGFFDKYCHGYGVDIGYGGDLLVPGCLGWDIEDGDSHYLGKLDDEQFDFVYSSHLLEHLDNPELAILNWWRVLKPGGYLILYLPDRDLFEKRKTLPSKISLDHKHYFLLERDEPPHTIGIIPFLKRNIKNFEIVYAKTCGDNCANKVQKLRNSTEYSIEVVVEKIRSRDSHDDQY